MKRLILIICIILFIFAYADYYKGDWTVYSYTHLINDIDGDLDYVYAAANTGILAIDKFTDEITPILTFRKPYYDFPIYNIIADHYDKYNLYFTGKEYIYHYDWFNDELVQSKIKGVSGSIVERMGVNADYIFVQCRGIIMRIGKNDFTTGEWEKINDTTLAHMKIENTDFNAYKDILPYNRLFNNKVYDFTCFHEDMNYLWVGTDGAGIYKIDLNSLNEIHLMTGTGGVDNQAMAMDSFGNIWIAGMRTQSIARFNTMTGEFIYYPVENYIQISNNDIVNISCSRDYVFFGTNGGQAFLYSFKKDRFVDIKNEKGSIIFRSAPMSNSSFIVSNNMGIALIDAEARTFTQKNEWLMPSVIDIELFNDSIYIVSSNTLYAADTKTLLFKKIEFDFPVFTIYQYFTSEDEQILIDNAYIHIHRNKVWESFPVVGFFGDIYDLKADNENIWICGRDGIGRFFKKDNHWKIYNRDNSPMPSTFTFNILSEKGYLYGNSVKGFFKFHYSNPMLNE